MKIAAILTACSVLNIKTFNGNITGAWFGTLKITSQVALKIVFSFKALEGKESSVTLGYPYQGAYAIAGKINFLSADSVNVTM